MLIVGMFARSPSVRTPSLSSSQSLSYNRTPSPNPNTHTQIPPRSPHPVHPICLNPLASSPAELLHFAVDEVSRRHRRGGRRVASGFVTRLSFLATLLLVVLLLAASGTAALPRRATEGTEKEVQQQLFIRVLQQPAPVNTVPVPEGPMTGIVSVPRSSTTPTFSHFFLPSVVIQLDVN